MKTSKPLWIFLLLLTIVVPVYPCTIFVLTNEKQTLFFNNEDWSSPASRLWFVPAGKDYFGCAYLGFDNGWAQGGVNEQGLAFDWVAGFENNWNPGPELQRVTGNPSERMLESCASVREAIAFYKKYREPSFSAARIMIADKTGASVIIGVNENGELFFDFSTVSRGFGYGSKILSDRLSLASEVSIDNGTSILQECKQDGMYATKYSNVFDLKSGDITLLVAQRQMKQSLNIHKELLKGGHYFELPKLSEQVTQTTLPLLPNMHRFLLDNYRVIPDYDPKATRHFMQVTNDAISGKLKANDFASAFWEQLSPQQENMRKELVLMGRLLSMQLLEVKKEKQLNNYFYAVEFEYLRVVQWISVNKEGKITSIRSVDAETK